MGASLLFVAQSAPYPWTTTWSAAQTVATRLTPPAGFTRVTAGPDSFGAWLRNLPLKPGRPEVRLFDGRPKSNQSAQYAVLDIDVGTHDLQQCADAVIRLRAEYLLATGQADRISFKFTSGHVAKWSDWKAGLRPIVRGSNVQWTSTAPPDGSYRNFRAYLDVVFTYAGSLSLSRELQAVQDERSILPGDVFIQGGSPGHAVTVIDVAEARTGERVFLIAQSYMPAQDVHILINVSESSLSPWYRAGQPGPLGTPEWTFPAGSLKRFAAGQR